MSIDRAQNDKENKHAYEKLWALIEPIKKGMLHTLAETDAALSGKEIHSRPMQNVQENFCGKLYFFTNREASQAEEIRDDSSVAVSYVDVENDNYVHLRGIAKTTSDPALIDQLWNRYVSLWFPDGQSSDEVCLIEINVQSAEYWESRNGVKQTWSALKARVNDERPDMSINKELDLSEPA